MIFMFHLAETGIGHFWLGINDEASEGNFVYNSDNKPITWNNWHKPGEPNDAGQYDRVVEFHSEANGI